MKRISIVGSGWLAKPLYRALEETSQVTLSTTRQDKCQELAREGFNAEPVVLGSQSLEGPLSFFDCDVLILTIPPHSGTDSTSRQFRHLSSFLREHGQAPHLLMTSSTSVFAEDQGDVNESTRPTARSANGIELILAEQALWTEHNSILRLGGLVGPGRHPGRFLTGRKDLPRPHSPINLIHLDDAVGILKSIIVNESWGEIFHGVCPDHRSRKEFYTQASLSLDLPPPEFAPGDEERPKRVLSRKVDYLLNYHFLHPSLDVFLSPQA